MKVALVSDSHGSVDPRIVSIVSACDAAVHAGDVGGGKVLAALRPKQALIAVRGNNDTYAKWPPGERTVLDALPSTELLELPGGMLAVVHGDRHVAVRTRHERLRAEFPQARCIVYGHSHRLSCDTGRRPWVLNPGACGRSRTFGGPSCIVLYAGKRRWRFEVMRFPRSA